jgi:hypothetical protein
MKRDPALDRFCDRDDFRLLMLDRTFPTKSFARTYGRLDLAHRTHLANWACGAAKTLAGSSPRW